MSEVFSCISRWRAAPNVQYDFSVQSVTFDSKGHMIVLIKADKAVTSVAVAESVAVEVSTQATNETKQET